MFISISLIPTDSEQQVELSDLIGSLNKSSEHGNLKKRLVSKYLFTMWTETCLLYAVVITMINQCSLFFVYFQDSMQRNAGTLDVPLAKPEVQKVNESTYFGYTKGTCLTLLCKF